MVERPRQRGVLLARSPCESGGALQVTLGLIEAAEAELQRPELRQDAGEIGVLPAEQRLGDVDRLHHGCDGLLGPAGRVQRVPQVDEDPGL